MQNMLPHKIVHIVVRYVLLSLYVKEVLSVILGRKNKNQKNNYININIM